MNIALQYHGSMAPEENHTFAVKLPETFDGDHVPALRREIEKHYPGAWYEIKSIDEHSRTATISVRPQPSGE